MLTTLHLKPNHTNKSMETDDNAITYMHCTYKSDVCNINRLSFYSTNNNNNHHEKEFLYSDDVV